MPQSFPKPKFKFLYSLSSEVSRLRQHRAVRGVPSPSGKNLLLATWNIANFGGQARRDEDHKIIAEIVSWFDVVAIQEVKENFVGLFDVLHALGAPYRTVFSDVAGNNERMVYVYNAERVKLLEEVGEVAFPVARIRKLKFKGVGQRFEGFDRSPYVATFQRGKVSFLLVNVHLFFGKETSRADMNRRALETFAVATYAADRRRSKTSFTREVVALGDFNMPKKAKGDPIYNALTTKGLMLPRSHLKGWVEPER
jgi:endonuclease/exonuclease/phosphatase family metal-dependent hydrolase